MHRTGSAVFDGRAQKRPRNPLEPVRAFAKRFGDEKGSKPDEPIAAIRAAIARAPRGHDFDHARETVSGQVSCHMSDTGG